MAVRDCNSGPITASVQTRPDSEPVVPVGCALYLPPESREYPLESSGMQPKGQQSSHLYNTSLYENIKQPDCFHLPTTAVNNSAGGGVQMPTFRFCNAILHENTTNPSVFIRIVTMHSPTPGWG